MGGGINCLVCGLAMSCSLSVMAGSLMVSLAQSLSEVFGVDFERW